MKSRQGGQALVDYSLILALFLIMAVVVVVLLGHQILGAFQNVVHTFQTT